MKNWKKASAAILAAGLITTSAGQVWANETEKVESPKVVESNIQEALENVEDGTVSAQDLEVISSIVPTGYTANNIFALSKNIEKVSNPKAKAALQKNIDKALAKWEEKNTEETEVPEVPEVPEVETPEVPDVETPEEDSEVPVVKASEVDAEVKAELKSEQKAATLAKVEENKAEARVKDEEKKVAAQAKAEEKKVEAQAKAEEKKAAAQAKAEEKKAAAEEKSSKGNKDKE